RHRVRLVHGVRARRLGKSRSVRPDRATACRLPGSAQRGLRNATMEKGAPDHGERHVGPHLYRLCGTQLPGTQWAELFEEMLMRDGSSRRAIDDVRPGNARTAAIPSWSQFS